MSLKGHYKISTNAMVIATTAQTRGGKKFSVYSWNAKVNTDILDRKRSFLTGSD